MNTIKKPEELLDYMKKHIQFGYLGEDGIVHLPMEEDFNDVWYDSYVLETYEDVLKTQVGNCWDQTEFERTWFLSHGYEVKTFYEQVILDYENIYPTHSFLTFQDNGKWYWFENSDGSNAGIHEFDDLDHLLTCQLSHYVSFLKNNYHIKEDEIDKIKLFMYEEPKYHSSAEDYIENIIHGARVMDVKRYYK